MNHSIVFSKIQRFFNKKVLLSSFEKWILTHFMPVVRQGKCHALGHSLILYTTIHYVYDLFLSCQCDCFILNKLVIVNSNFL